MRDAIIAYLSWLLSAITIWLGAPSVSVLTMSSAARLATEQRRREQN